MSLEKTGSVLEGLVRELGLESSLKLHRIRERWEELFGGPISRHAAPSSLNEGRLLVTVDSSAWLQQMNFYRGDLLRRLSPLGVTDVRLRLGRVRRKKEGPPSQPPAAMSEETRAYIEEVLLGVKDGELRERLRGAMENWALKGHGNR